MKRMKPILWTAWALVPVALIAFHFGPGQAMYREDRAAKLVAHAEELQREALRLQGIAYDAHLAAIAARVAAFGKDDDALRQAAVDAGAREDAAYADASAAWRTTADALSEAQTQVDEIGLGGVDVRAIEGHRALQACIGDEIVEPIQGAQQCRLAAAARADE